MPGIAGHSYCASHSPGDICVDSIHHLLLLQLTSSVGVALTGLVTRIRRARSRKPLDEFRATSNKVDSAAAAVKQKAKIVPTAAANLDSQLPDGPNMEAGRVINPSFSVFLISFN